jgi:hypothetical protein
MEDPLHERFLAMRNKASPDRLRWFRVNSKRLFTECYPTDRTGESDLVFSTGVTLRGVFEMSKVLTVVGRFVDFLHYCQISIRSPTNKGAGMPRGDTAAINNFVQLCRRNGEPEHRLTPYCEALQPNVTAELPRLEGNVLPSERAGVLFPGMVANMDQTSMPFAFLEGRTYATKGAKDVQLKSAKSGWSRRKATLMINIFANGIAQIPPIILFNGKSDSNCTRHRTQREQAAYNAECACYHPGVVVLFDTEAYSNEDVTLWWTLEYLIPTMPNERPVMAEIPPGRTLPSPQYTSILARDVVRFQHPERVKSLLREYNVASAAIPGNCSGDFHPLDVCFKSLFKRHLE